MLAMMYEICQPKANSMPSDLPFSSVIEALDSMKKGKENYLAREAIKFLEREFKVGNRFIHAQQASETVQQPGRKRPPKQDPNVW